MYEGGGSSLPADRSATHAELAKNFIQTIGRVLDFLNRYDAPFIAKVHRPAAEALRDGKSGRVSMWLSYARWAEVVAGAVDG